MDSNSSQESFIEHLLYSRTWSRHWGYVRKQDRQKSLPSGSRHFCGEANTLQSKVDGVKSREMMKGNQEGFFEEMLFEQTLMEVREEATKLSWGRALQTEEQPVQRPLSRTVLWGMSCVYDDIHT